MGSKVTLGMVKMWEQTVDETTREAMAHINIISARNKVLARYDVETEMGARQIRERLAKAEATVEQLKQALKDMGVEYSGYGRSKKQHERYVAAIDARSIQYNTPEVAALLAAIQTAKEQVRLAVFPSEVRAVLSEIKAQVTATLPALLAAEKKSKQLAARIKAEEIED